MPRHRPLAHLLPELIRTLFVGRITVSFPFGPLDLPSYYRGKVVVQPELCEGCGLCVRNCPAFALDLEREGRGKFRLTHYRDRCAYCGQCADDCPQGAIVQVNEFAEAAPRRDAFAQLVVQRDADAGRD